MIRAHNAKTHIIARVSCLDLGDKIARAHVLELSK